MTMPKHHSVFLRTQPRRSIFSLSRENLLSFQFNVPVNLSNLLFGGSQITSPEKGFKQHQAIYYKDGRETLKDISGKSLKLILCSVSPSKSISLETSPKSEVTVRACRTFRFVSLFEDKY